MANGLRNYFVGTRYGQLVFCVDPSVRASDRPVALLIHGAFRNAAAQVPFAEQLAEFDIVFANLPGHGGVPELPEISVEAWTDAFAEALPVLLPGRQITAVGESVGALIAMGLPVHAVAAFEPFLETDGLWPMARSMENASAVATPYWRRFGESVLVGQSYRSVLSRIQAPTMVVAGDVPLMPERELPGPPSLLDDASFDVFAQHPMIEARRISGGHVLLQDNPAACAELVRQISAKGRPSVRSPMAVR